MNRSRFALPLLPLFFALLPALNSSAESRCIQGKVVDPTGAAVPFAFVSATSLDRRTSTQVQVGRNGRFRIDQGLTDGQYDVLPRTVLRRMAAVFLRQYPLAPYA
jgi:hypothetical protein